MPWKPTAPGEVPTLGWYVIDWMSEMLARPALGYYEPFIPYREQEDFILRWYEIDPATGRFKYDRGLIGRARGWGKSPILAGLSIVEALADVVPAGWDSSGQPVGAPWSHFKTPLVQIAAVSEEQTRNTWQPLLEMVREGPVLDAYPGVEPLDTMVNLPRGQIRQITASARTVKGAPSVFAVLDQTEEWVPSNGGVRLAQTIRTNTTKNGGRTLESPNAYIPGEKSVAEDSAAFALAIREGRSRATGLLYDHREAPAETDMTDRESLIAGLRVAYGDSSAHPDGCVIHDPPCAPGHLDLEPVIARIWDPATDTQIARSDFLNQITHASDAYLSQPEWAGCTDATNIIADRDVITLGFDGSRGRAKGKPDATALIGCRVSDGHMFEVAVWEADDKRQDSWDAWEPPLTEIEAAIADAFKRYTVVGFYADPAKDWRSYVNKWEAAYGSKVKVKAGREHPFEWWMTGGRSGLIQRAVEQFEGAVRNQDMSHDGSYALTRHMLNARRRVRHGKLGLGKESDYSTKKIDAAVAAILAWQARLDAVAAGIGATKKRQVPKRIR